MKEIGIIVMLLGISLAYFALDMDTTVSVRDETSSSNYGFNRVNNLGKMNEQQNLVIGASALCIIGTILFVGGTIEKRMINSNLPSSVMNLNHKSVTPDHSDDSKLTPMQRELKAKYERSEISLEDYTREWNKLI